jgi:hypothetical protein
LRIDIRPFNESEHDTTTDSPSDARASDFIDTLRARVTSQDEAQRQTWLKAAKPESKRKRTSTANPDWLNSKKPAQTIQKKSATSQQQPFRKPVKRSPR